MRSFPCEKVMNSVDQSSRPMTHKSQFELLGTRRFLPFFLTQFAGAFNDNLYKNSLVLLVVYAGMPVLGMQSTLLVNLAAFLFILPFFIFSALAGQLADKYEKSAIIRWVKLAEIVIMGAAAVAFFFQWYAVLLLLLFLMGAQSAFFGPVKYALLPQALERNELVGGNAMVEMGTFVAILVGTIAAGIIVSLEGKLVWIACGIVGMAVLGYMASRRIPALPVADANLKINFNLWTETWRVVQGARGNHAVFLSIMAISWFWFLGASYLTQFPAFVADVLHGSERTATALLAIFTVGIGLGSLLCERVSGKRVELGIVPLGSLGLSLFGIDLFFSIPSTASNLVEPAQLLTDPDYRRMLIDFLGIGMAGGFFVVPLNAFVQQETPMEKRARVIAANNVLNALFMVVSAGAGMLLLGKMALSLPDFFLVLALMNIAVALFVYSQVPLFALRFVVWVLSHTIYRVRHTGLDAIPETGPCVLVCNHVSYMDALVLAGAVRRPVRFVMDVSIFRLPLLGGFFRLAQAIPVASQKREPAIYAAAFEAVHRELAAGNVVCIFPEGKLTTNGEVDVFRKGIETILARDAVPVVPMALSGLWGSFFSHQGGTAFTHWPHRFWSRIDLRVGQPVPAAEASADRLREQVVQLRGERP